MNNNRFLVAVHFLDFFHRAPEQVVDRLESLTAAGTRLGDHKDLALRLVEQFLATAAIGIVGAGGDFVANLDQADNTLDNISAKVHILSLPIERDISYIADLKALVLLTRLFLRERFILTHSVTPKAGLIANLAGYLSRGPNRLHTFTGQVWLTQNGFKHWLLKSMDKWIVMLATKVLADSVSQRDFLIKHEIVKEDSIVVLEDGSISGVDLLRFHPSSHVRKSIRHTLNLDPSAKVLLFLGRMKVDKGVLDHIEEFVRFTMVIRFNSVELNPPSDDGTGPGVDHGHGLFETACRMNHSCKPNCIWITSQDGKAKEVRAIETIEEGEELTILDDVFRFTDFNGKFIYNLNQNNRLSFSSLYIKNKLNYANEDSDTYGLRDELETENIEEIDNTVQNAESTANKGLSTPLEKVEETEKVAEI